jgi:hypothetical protein
MVIDFTRILIGWFWLMAVVAALLTGSILLDLGGVALTDADLLTRPQYLIAMVTLPTISYLIVSSVTLVTQMPMWWLFFAFIVFVGWARAILENVWPLQPLVPWYIAISDTLSFMISAPVSRATPPAESWALATLFGCGIAALCLLAASRRYARPTR